MATGSDREIVERAIVSAFGNNVYPGDAFLLGSHMGCEPQDQVSPFQGKTKWQEVSAKFLDEHGSALSFFSEAGLRFFLPAYLLADIRGELQYAEPIFTLVSGFSDVRVEVKEDNRSFVIKSGRSQLVNPRLYGASTFLDYARYRLSVFSREEAQAIVLYLEYKQTHDECESKRIEQALHDYWHERARNAPSNEDLQEHIREREKYVRAITNDALANEESPDNSDV
jgi:hypothetical protein